MDQPISLTLEEKTRVIAWCEQESEKYRAMADATSRCNTQVAMLVSQGTGHTAASLQVVSVLLGGDPVPAPPPEEPDKTGSDAPAT